MSKEIAISAVPAGFQKVQGGGIWCEKCGLPVEEWKFERLSKSAERWGMAYKEPTGEVLLTVRCHGEIYSVSNWRGEL